MLKDEFYWDLLAEGYDIITAMMRYIYDSEDTSQNIDHYQV